MAEAVRITEPPVIDGVMDDACWKENQGFSDFILSYPVLGEASDDSTRIIICYDDDALYIGCFCYYAEPDQVVARLVPREKGGDGDDITICFDTYNDDRTGYLFSVSGLDNQRDIQVSGGGWPQNGAWNGVWYNKASIVEYGWFAEIVIPWKTLRFPPVEEQVWGLYVSRWLDRKLEKHIWSDYEPEDNGMHLLVARFGELRGISGVKPGVNLQFLPHLTQTAMFDGLFDSVSFVPLKNGVTGLDVKWAASSNLILDITAFPDYGQIEADPERINLSQFEHHHRERRPFFTEGADIFGFPFSNPVYTRRIGRKLDDGTEVPIFGGLKTTGKLGGRTEFGMLEAYTAETGYVNYDGYTDTMPSALYSIGRINVDILERSTVGAIFTSREMFTPTTPSLEHKGDRVAGVNLNLWFPSEWGITFAGLHTFHTDKAGGPVGVLSFQKDGRWEIWTHVTYSDTLADLNAVGYIEQPGKFWSEIGSGYRANWGEGILRKAEIKGGYEPQKWLWDEELTHHGWMLGSVTFSNQLYCQASGSFSRKYFYEDDSTRWTGSGEVGFNTSRTKVVWGGLWVNVWDQYIYEDYEPQYFGHVTSIRPEVSFRPVHNFILSLEANGLATWHDDWIPDSANFFRWTAGECIQYTATRYLSFRFRAQQNTDSEYYTQQILAVWEIAPLSYLYLASSANLEGDTETPDPFDVEVSDVTFYGKIVYLFSI